MTSEPIFLTLDEVLQIHSDMIAEYGGADGVRDLGLLESALAQPSAGFGGEFFHGDMPSMAAAYLFHLAKNHAFVDGNKRTGAAAAIVFLKLNGIAFRSQPGEIADLTERLAEGSATKEDAVAFFRCHIETIE